MPASFAPDVLEAQILVRYTIYVGFTFGLIAFGAMLGYWTSRGRALSRDLIVLLTRQHNEILRLRMYSASRQTVIQTPRPFRYPSATFYGGTYRNTDVTQQMRALPQSPDASDGRGWVTDIIG